MSTNTKNQHYIPQNILAHFANEKEQLFEALIKQKKVYQTKYRQSMSERYVYEHPNLDTNLIENQFSILESDFAPRLKKILSLLKEKDPEISEIKRQIEACMIDFLIFYYRSGALLNEFSFNGTEDGNKISLMLEKIMNSKYLIKLSESVISSYSFSIIKSEEKDFIMSDQYVSTASLNIKGRFSNISNRHIGLKDVIIMIPLSSEFYVIYSNGKTPSYIKENTINILTEDQIKEINKVIFNNSYKKAVGLNKSMLEEGLSSFRFESPSRAIMVYESGMKTGALNKKEVFFYQEDIEQWEYFTKIKHTINMGTKRNELCKCGSGKKFKKCCSDKFHRNFKIVSDMYNRHYKEIYANPYHIIEKSLEEYDFI
ncbi:hypothetical protein CHH83_02250 [Bacillus sp. 7586-K]|nr:hypothetical protein CHH83_02250 [Bacillus sp. 7586-K]